MRIVGQDSIVRLLEVGGEPATSWLTFPLFNVQHAWTTNAVEENQQEIPRPGSSVDFSIKPHQVLTFAAFQFSTSRHIYLGRNSQENSAARVWRSGQPML